MQKSSMQPRRPSLAVLGVFGVLLALMGAAATLVLHSEAAYAAGTSVSVGSQSFSRAANGYLNATVTATISGYTGAGQPCASGTTCSATLEVQHGTNGPVEAVLTQNLNRTDPITVTLSGRVNTKQVTSWRISVSGTGTTYSAAWTTISDSYPAAQTATVPSGTTLTRNTKGWLAWNMTVSASGYAQPDRACAAKVGDSGQYCVLALQGQRADGTIDWLQYVNITPGSDYPTKVTLSGSQNLPPMVAWRLAIYGDNQDAEFEPSWTSFTDPYPAETATIVNGSYYRDGDGYPHWNVNANFSGYSQPNRSCGNAPTCTVGLEVRLLNGDSQGLDFKSIPSGQDYPTSVNFADGRQGIGQFTAWRVWIEEGQASGGYTFFGPWKTVADVQPAELRGGSNAALDSCPCKYGDPINAYTGSFDESTTDLSLTGSGPAVGLTRSYSSMPSKVVPVGIFGRRWTSSMEAALTFPTSSSATVAQENGAQVPFTKNTDGSFTAPGWMNATLSYNSTSQTYTFVRRGNETLTFNSTGQLLSISDLNGNAVTISRNGSGQISTMTGSGGRAITLTWTGSQLTKLTDSASRTVLYSYDDAGNLATVTAPDGGVTSYTYDGAGRILTVTRPALGVTTNTYYDTGGLIATQTDPVGRQTSFSYSGGTTTITKPSGVQIAETYSGGLLVKRVVDAAGTQPRTTTNTWDGAGNLLSTTDPSGSTTSATYDAANNALTKTNALGKVTTYTYNGLHEVLTTTDPLSRKTSATYNTTGQKLTSVDAAGKTKTWTYNTDGTAKTLTDQLGKITTYSYDSSGRPTGSTDADGRVRAVAYNAAGFVTSETDPAGKATLTTRDAVGRPLTVKDADANVTTNTYDADGNLTKVTDARGHNATAIFDKADQKTSATDANGGTTAWTYTADGEVSTLTDPRGNVTTNAYDTFVELISVTDAAKQVTKTTYDVMGRPLTVTTPSGAVRKTSYDAAGETTSTTDPLGKITKYTYDAAGQQTSITDPLNRVSKQAYSSTGLPTIKTLPGNSTETTAYDAAGQQTSFTNADGLVTSYTWTPGGLMASKTEPGSMVTSYTYDTAGRAKTLTTPDGHVTTTSYSDAGRPTRVHSDVTGTTDITYTWDANGNRASMADVTGITNYTYDNGDRLTSTTNGVRKTISYAYNSADDLTSITYPGTKTATYGYNVLDQMTSVKDWANRTTTFTWTTDGQLLTQGYANGITETRTYDTAGQLKQLKDVTSGGTTIGTYGYGYDAAGQLTTDSSNDPLGASVAHTYTYDTTSQLATIAGSGTTGATTATPGKRLTKVPAVGASTSSTLAYNAKQQVTSLTPATGTATSYSYDSNGNRTGTTTGTSSTTYSYTAFGDLAAATLPTKTVTYTTDGDHLRQSRTSAGATKQFLWNTAGALPLLLDDGTQTYLYGPGTTPIAQIDSSGTIQYLHTDLLGSPRLITTTTATTAATKAYTAHGTPTAGSGTATTSIGYTGNWTDPDTGLVYLRARDYDPTTSQFLAVDPAINTTRQPYAYTGNNPLLLTDPSGLTTAGGCLGFSAILGPVGFSGELCLVVSIDRTNEIRFGATATDGFFAPGTKTVGTPSIGITAFEQITDADTVEQLGGYSLGAGGSRGDYGGNVFVGEDPVCDLPAGRVIGKEAGLAAGRPTFGELHATRTKTTVWQAPFSINPLRGFIPPAKPQRSSGEGTVRSS